jgi:hypothetical protein
LEASDEATRKYLEETDQEDRFDADITTVMREAAKTKAASFRDKFSKYTAVANPRLGDQFLEEVQYLFDHSHLTYSIISFLLYTLVLQHTLTLPYYHFRLPSIGART